MNGSPPKTVKITTFTSIHQPTMTNVKTYDNLPSSAIQQVIIDTNTNQVQVVYKSSDKQYTYSAEDAAAFDQQFLAEFDTEDFSVGKFINSNVSSGNLQLLTN